MAYRDELLAARSRLSLLERELAARRAEPERLRAWLRGLRDERRRLKRAWRHAPAEAGEPRVTLPRVEELARELRELDGPQLEIRARAVEAELRAGDSGVRALRGEVDRLRDECRALREHPRATLWPYVAGGLVAAGLAYLVVYSIFVWWLARVSILGLN